MENKSTPGPWKYRAGYYGGFPYENLFVVEEAIDKSGAIDIAHKVTEANARLIAAAPALLAALEDVRLNPPCDGATFEETRQWWGTFAIWRQEARTALLLAKGGTK